MLEYFNLKN